MAHLVCKCVDNIFINYDYNNIPIKNELLKNHNTKENAWIAIDKNVYSIRKDDYLLLDIFKNLYGKNVKNFINNNSIFSNQKEKILLLEKLKKRKIGFLIEN
jgi:hypothetical protein